MNVRHLTILSLMDQRRSSYMIPHLSTSHGKDKDQSNQSPSIFVIQELQIVSAHINEDGGDTKEGEHSNGSSVIGRPEHTDIDFCPLSNPFGNGIGTEADSLDVHRVQFLRFAFGGEVHKNGSGI